MSTPFREWCDRTWSKCGCLPEGVGSDLLARWHAHAGLDCVVLTLFGLTLFGRFFGKILRAVLRLSPRLTQTVKTLPAVR